MRNGLSHMGKKFGSDMKILQSKPQLKLGLWLVGFLGLAAACADESKPLNTFDSDGEGQGPKATEIEGLITPIFAIAGVVFVLVIGGAILLTIKNRVKPEDYDPEDLPTQTHGNFSLEIMWTIAPAILLAVISVFMVQTIWDLETKNAEGELDVMVIGQQWWWEYRYDVDGDGFYQDANGDGVVDEKDAELPLTLALDPDDIVTANELVIPVGQQVDLEITSRDVIHSFWIPALNGKRDAVPGRVHTWSVEADEAGKYTGWCTEYCGLSHARMRMSAIALTPEDFETWIANQAEPAEVPEEDTKEWRGRETFAANCSSCHIVDEGDFNYDDYDPELITKAAPNLTHFATRSAFAGSIYEIYLGDKDGDGQDDTDANDNELDVSDYLILPQEASQEAESSADYRANSAQLKRWIQNAPSQKAMAPDEQRGMPAFPGLSDEQLDELVAYLATLD